MILGIGMRGIFPYLPSADQASSILASTVMPPLLGSLFLVAMMSAIMSTVNSILLVTGGAFAHDLYKRLVNPEASQARLVWVNRLSIVVLGLVPVLVRLAQARRRPGDRHRTGEVHRQLLLRAGRPRAELAARDERGRDLEHGGGVSRLPGLDVHVSARLRVPRHRRGGGRRRAEHGTFILVSRATPPTPAENLRIFFDRVWTLATSGG